MTRDAGYTLVEMLAALTVIGLAFGALGAAMHILTRHQHAATSHVADGEARANAQVGLSAAFAGAQADDIQSGDRGHVLVSCPQERCSRPEKKGLATVLVAGDSPQSYEVRAPAGYKLEYQTSLGRSDRWSAGGPEELKSIVLVADAEAALPIAVVRLRQQQAFDCQYDVIVASCREQSR